MLASVHNFIRPDAFSYGALAGSKTFSILIYRPPGTRKVHLTETVAKESGVNILKVFATDLFDTFVFASINLIKGLFSLARKLKPCIVFIYRPDPLFFAYPTYSHSRNQFLRECDSMNDPCVLLVLATNRPFDLHKDVLRQFPHKFFIDLPVEKERKAILKVHLRNETLDNSVSLSQVAEDTLNYSGANLKKLCAASALAFLHDKNAQQSSDIVVPKKRILTNEHFRRAWRILEPLS